MQPVTPLKAGQITGRLQSLLEAGSPEITAKDGVLHLAGKQPVEITKDFGSPLYVYSERILRARCRDLRHFLQYEPFVPNYSCKANSNVALLKIIHEEGFHADAMSPGEIKVLRTAGFGPDEIFFVSNYAGDEELLYAINEGVTVSVDSLPQLERYGRLNPGGEVAVRINPGMGDGHHKKVITGGASSKFGVFYTKIEQLKSIAAKYNLKVVGLNQHIGSNYLKGDTYLASVKRLLSIAEQFDDLDFLDFGGGMGICYTNDGKRLDIATLGAQVTEVLEEWTKSYGKRIKVQIEPGRYIVAESGLLLMTVTAIKENPGIVFVGTDAGFNVLARPAMYGSYHEIVNSNQLVGDEAINVTVCGNICESGDLFAEDRPITNAAEGDVLVALDAGAYGFSMSSNYNSRLRPAEVLITQSGQLKLIRERDTFEDILRHQVY